ncbi:MAG: APC family permease [Candidatus Aramenus sp.]|jgi:amino acid transporter|nr:APC family permease [Candidatus Aramenus sp.]
METKKVFLRESSGLVREVSPWSSLLASWALVTGGIPILIIEWLYLDPGINWTLSFLVTLIPALGSAFLFYVSGVSMPRAGGDYVFNSRASSPWVGFVNYFGLFVAFALSLGLYSYYAASWFSYLFSGLGLYYNNQALLNLGNFFGSTNGSVIVGVVVVVISSLLAFSNRLAWKFVLVSGIVSVLSTVVLFATLATISPSSFAHALSSFTGMNDAYNEVIKDAVSNGLSFVSNPIAGALLGIPVVWYYFTWYNLPASWSGEMKSVRKNVMYSIVVSIVLIALYYVMFTQLSLDAFGNEFLTAWSYISANGVNDPVYNSLSSIGPFIPFFVLMVNHNVVLYFISFLALWLPNFYSNPPLVIALTRYLFAWSFDRVAPAWLADVNDRLHVPLKATAVITAVGIIGVLMYAYLQVIETVDVTVVFEIGYAVFAISTALMPFLKKDMFSTSVPFKRRIMGVPIISWVGFGVFAFLMYALAVTFNNPVLLPINVPTLASLGVIYGGGALIYSISKRLNASKGIDIGLVFKEIPPE